MFTSLCNGDFTINTKTQPTQGKKQKKRPKTQYIDPEKLKQQKFEQEKLLYEKRRSIETGFPIIYYCADFNDLAYSQSRNNNQPILMLTPSDKVNISMAIPVKLMELDFDKTLKLPSFNVGGLHIGKSGIVATEIYLHIVFNLQEKINTNTNTYKYGSSHFIEDEIIIGKTIDDKFFAYKKQAFTKFQNYDYWFFPTNDEPNFDVIETHIIKQTFQEITKSKFIGSYNDEINTLIKTINKKHTKPYSQIIIQIDGNDPSDEDDPFGIKYSVRYI
jgi:hypothetical protein